MNTIKSLGILLGAMILVSCNGVGGAVGNSGSSTIAPIYLSPGRYDITVSDITSQNNPADIALCQKLVNITAGGDFYVEPGSVNFIGHDTPLAEIESGFVKYEYNFASASACAYTQNLKDVQGNDMLVTWRKCSFDKVHKSATFDISLMYAVVGNINLLCAAKGSLSPYAN